MEALDLGSEHEAYPRPITFKDGATNANKQTLNIRPGKRA